MRPKAHTQAPKKEPKRTAWDDLADEMQSNFNPKRMLELHHLNSNMEVMARGGSRAYQSACDRLMQAQRLELDTAKMISLAESARHLARFGLISHIFRSLRQLKNRIAKRQEGQQDV